MTKTTIFDVLIVYSERLASSANSLSDEVLTPFPKGSKNETYNIVYGYFLKICKKNNLKTAFTSSADIVGAGICRSYWLFENNKWIKVRKVGYSKLIFDKFSPSNRKAATSRKLLFSSYEVKPFSHPYIFNLFFDKQQTYKKLHKYSLPTVTIKDATRESIYGACKMLNEIISRHPHKYDFSDEIIMKDRFGAGGLHVYKFKTNQTKKMMSKMVRNENISYIIQPFAIFDKGFIYKNSEVAADIRLIYLGGNIIQTYVRMAKTGDFRCNEHQGGTLKYIPQSQVPMNVIITSNKIAKILNKKSSLFALDFIISNNGNIYLLEGNTGPGLDWNLSIKKNEIEAQKLIRIIIKELVRLVGLPILISKKETHKILTEVPINGEYTTMSNSLVST
ncbi:hypothetical protein A2Z22_05335 [Candidatus Woesebacteria bacterium RBG_16_34_12]|uniref:ATP-grasp domain-containing protein n=1 Tax=Candidatus Woesebacteria bacterium RBG_16_34_12 TaxID=1802480 RepID=A0A1F7X6U0_9BACT|nr:MAG: hypothetical protein A2Z22_05335 [Candidatus Woesebacteria bacterium RBG_16_34_12]